MDSEDRIEELKDESLEQVAGGDVEMIEKCPKCGGELYTTHEPANDGKHIWAITAKCYLCDYRTTFFRP